MANIIAQKTRLAYHTQYPKAVIALGKWYHELLKSDYKNLNELKKVYGNVCLVGDDRMVFNMMGNKIQHTNTVDTNLSSISRIPI